MALPTTTSKPQGGLTSPAAQTLPSPAAPSPSFTTRKGILAPLAIANYRWYFIVGLCISGAFGMQQLSFSYLMYEITGKPALVGLNLLAMAIPQISLSFVGGVIADRVSKRTIMMFTFTAAALIFGIVGVAQQQGFLTWGYLVAASFGMGAVTSFQMPSRQGILTQLVGREHLTAAIGLNQANMNVTQLAAPALAGILIGTAGIAWVFFFMAGLNLLAVLGLQPIKYASVRSTARWTIAQMVGNMVEGLRYVRSNANVRNVLIFSLLTTTFAMPYTVLLPVLAKDVLHADAQRLGFLLSASGVGALIGSLLMTTTGKAKRGLLFIHTAFVTGLALLSLSLSPWYAMTLVTMLVLGVAASARQTLPNILLQSYSENAYLGRVLSLYLLQFGVTSLGGFGVALAAQFIGVQWALLGTSLCLVVVALWYYRFSTGMKSLA